MRHLLYIACILILFLLQGVLMAVLPADISNHFAPFFSFVVIIYVAVRMGVGHGIVYGVCFGLLQDIVYGQAIGFYAFSIAMAAYLVATLRRFISDGVATFVVFAIMGTGLLRFFIFGFYRLFNLLDIGLADAFGPDFVLTLVLNGCFALLVYYPLRRLNLKKEATGR
jgi:rod shape-determining protein MreD